MCVVCFAGRLRTPLALVILTTEPTGSLVPAAVSYSTADRFFAAWTFLSAFLLLRTNRIHFKGVTAHCLCLVKSACLRTAARERSGVELIESHL